MKGASDLWKVALGIVIAVILIGAATIIFVETHETGMEIIAEDRQRIDQITLLNGTAVALPEDDLIELYSVVNGTSGAAVDSGNYTYSLSAGTVTLTTINAPNYNNSAVNVTYTFNNEDDVFATSMNESWQATGDFADWWPLIVLAVMLGVVMFYILRSTGALGGRRAA